MIALSVEQVKAVIVLKKGSLVLSAKKLKLTDSQFQRLLKQHGLVQFAKEARERKVFGGHTAAEATHLVNQNDLADRDAICQLLGITRPQLVNRIGSYADFKRAVKEALARYVPETERESQQKKTYGVVSNHKSKLRRGDIVLTRRGSWVEAPAHSCGYARVGQYVQVKRPVC